ncbi:MAG: hypothetical protein ABIH22_04060 [Candidatus Margulisiibacteriota bacterium]
MAKYIKYSNHLRFRLEIRNIPCDLAKDIYNYSREHYYDTITKYYIAIGAAEYKRKHREMAVIYKEDGEIIEIITVHPLKRGQKDNRVKRGRWIRK